MAGFRTFCFALVLLSFPMTARSDRLQLANGDEWAWQAKFLRSSPGSAQWKQIDDSVKRALDKQGLEDHGKRIDAVGQNIQNLADSIFGKVRLESQRIRRKIRKAS